jgi:hypothetical protein
MFIFPEFIEGLKRFDELVMPLLRKRKLTNPLLPDANDAA